MRDKWQKVSSGGQLGYMLVEQWLWLLFFFSFGYFNSQIWLKWNWKWEQDIWMECVSVFVRFNETFTHVIEALIECRIDRVCEREDNLQHTLYTYLPLYSKLHFWVIFSARYLSKLCYPTHLRDCVCNAHKKYATPPPAFATLLYAHCSYATLACARLLNAF